MALVVGEKKPIVGKNREPGFAESNLTGRVIGVALALFSTSSSGGGQ